MKQKGCVTGLVGNTATVRVTRESACEGECKNDCASCGMGKKKVIVRARNTANAAAGDWVWLESDSKKLLVYAFFIYMFPLLLAFGGYALAFYTFELPELSSVLTALICFLLSFVPAVLMNRLAERRGTLVEITSLAEIGDGEGVQ